MENLYINLDVKLKQGGRNISKISPDEFINKCKIFINSNNIDDLDYDNEDIDDICNTLAFTIMSLYMHDEEHYICKDFKSIKFDYENTEVVEFVNDQNYPYIIASAGGDWEIPVIFMIYWDGKKIRVYIPKKGNTWRFDTKCALGNYETDDYSEYPTDEQYVFKHLDKNNIYDYDNYYYDYKDIDYNDVTYDLDSCINDFKTRLTYK